MGAHRGEFTAAERGIAPHNWPFGQSGTLLERLDRIHQMMEVAIIWTLAQMKPD